jgi:hypothetical protein
MANTIGTVAHLTGHAAAMAKDGTQRPLKVGDPVYEGEVIVTGPNSHVELAFANGHNYLVPAKEIVTLDGTVFGGSLPEHSQAALHTGADQTARIAQAIAQGTSLDDLLDETAAGLTGGDGNNGHSFVQLFRVVEAVSPASYAFAGDHGHVPPETAAGAGLADVRLSANSDSATTRVDEAVSGNVLANDVGITPLQVTGFSVDIDGNGSAEQFGPGQTANIAGVGSLTIGAGGGYTFIPAAGYTGPVPAVTYTETDSRGDTASGTLSINVRADTPPVARPDVVGTPADTNVTVNVLANDSDADGDKLVVVGLTNGAHGTTTLDPVTGNPMYIPATGWTGTDTFSYTVSDGHGGTATATVTVRVGAPTITVGTIAGDDIINAVEHGGAVTLSGSTTGVEAGQTVSVTLNGQTYTTTVQAGGNWSVVAPVIDVTKLADGSYTVSASVADKSGYPAGDTHMVTVDTAAAAAITVATVATDNVLNGTESTAANVPVTGTVSGDAKAGDTVTLTVNGHAYTGTVQPGNTYSINVSGADLLADPDHKVDASVTATDAAGNPVTVTAQGAYTVDTAAAAAITVATVATDNILNGAESTSANVPVTGTVSGDAKAGDTVTLTVNGHAYTGTVQPGNTYSINVSGADLLADPDHKVDASVTATDAAGNPITVTAQGAYTVDTSAAAAITVNTVATDNILNGAESAAANVPVTGTVSGDAKPGDTVTLTVNGHAYTGTVQPGNTYSINVSGADLLADPDHKVDASVTATDAAGNHVTVTAQGAYTVDTVAPIAPSLSASTTVGAITGLFNTGVDASGNAIAAGSADSHYTLISRPSGATFSTAVAVSQSAANGAAWATTDYAHSEWIGSTATNPSIGTFVYQTSFTLSGSVDLRSVDVQFDINADDNVVILVNGVNTGITLTSLWQSSSTQHVDLSGASNLFVLGTNTITFDITNTGSGPTGLKIDNMTATALTNDVMPVSVGLDGTGAQAGDILTFTANQGGTTSTSTHTLTAAEISAGSVVESEAVPTGNSVSTYTATLTDTAGNTSTVATETVFGSGNHSVMGTVGADVFKWTLDSHGVAGTPATDAIQSFSTIDNTDKLDLRDLLVGENHATGIGNLANYINITTSASGGVTSTEIRISHSGGFANGTYSAGAEDQHITLTGVNLFTTYGDTTSAQLIQHLLNHGKLVTD